MSESPATPAEAGHKPLQDVLLALLQLQDKDVKIRRLQRESEEKPREIVAIKEGLAGFRKAVEDAKEQIKKQTAEKNALETELESRIANMRKLETQSGQVKTNEEYRALLKEVDAIKHGNTSLEDKILDAMEKIEGAKARLAGEEQSLKQEEGKVAAREQVIAQEVAGIRARLEEVKKEREVLVVSVKPRYLERYQMTFENKEDYAVVTIEHGACGGCHMAITPQVLNEVKRAHDIVLCENCARILCLPPK